jgi:hypothetical protein
VRRYRSSATKESLPKLAEQARRDLGGARGRNALTLMNVWARYIDKFPTWTEFFASYEAAQQASGERISSWRARCFVGCGTVLDLCSGAGADTISLSRHVGRVIALDTDIERLTWARCNVARYGMDRVCFVQGDVTNELPRCDGALLDPSRRTDVDTGRAIDPRMYSPPADMWERIRRNVPNLAIKVAPGISYDDIPSDARVEFIQDRGQCREGVLWFGDLGRTAGTAAPRTATVLSGDSRAPSASTITAADETEERIGTVDQIIYNPAPAVVRAHLITQLAARLQAHRLDPEIAYLSGPTMSQETLMGSRSLVSAFAVEAVWRFNLKRLRLALSARRIGHLEILARRFPIPPDTLRNQLRLHGDQGASLICTRIDEYPTVVLCRRLVDKPD